MIPLFDFQNFNNAPRPFGGQAPAPAPVPVQSMQNMSIKQVFHFQIKQMKQKLKDNTLNMSSISFGPSFLIRNNLNSKQNFGRFSSQTVIHF